ncbi:hypothetical protein [Pedobacter sp. CG_S7]|uniref:hypothetical protein n=1 Tax=Pedobacter sp. CG_S7 TaxID=3143930 RepID=UPI0033931B0F
MEEFSNLKINVKAGQYICIHPSAIDNWQQCPALYFATLGDYCIKMNYQVVITGKKVEFSVINEMLKSMPKLGDSFYTFFPFYTFHSKSFFS